VQHRNSDTDSKLTLLSVNVKAKLHMFLPEVRRRPAYGASYASAVLFRDKNSKSVKPSRDFVFERLRPPAR